MKTKLLIISVFCLLFSCKKKETETKTNTKPFANLQQIVGIGRIEPENEIIQLSAEVGGIVEKIYKKENDSVQVGDIILEIKHTIEDANILQLKEAVAVQISQIRVDESAIQEQRIRFTNANKELQRLKSLLAKGAETQQTVDNATADTQAFQANIQRLQATVQVSKMKAEEMNAQVTVAQAKLQQKYIKAPVKGVLLELNIQTGNTIDSKQVVAQLNPEGKIVAVCEIDELFANKVEIGQAAIIRNFGAIDTLSTGKVYFAEDFLKKKSLFTDQAGEKEDRRVRKIKILLDKPARLLLNSRIECVVFLSKK